jgi:hypothetical protein
MPGDDDLRAARRREQRQLRHRVRRVEMHDVGGRPRELVQVAGRDRRRLHAAVGGDARDRDAVDRLVHRLARRVRDEHLEVDRVPEAVAEVLEIRLHAAAIRRIELPHLEHAQARRAHATSLRPTSGVVGASPSSRCAARAAAPRMSRRRASAAPRSSASSAAARITSSANVARS